MARLKYKDIKQQVEEKQWELKSETYTNLQTELALLCPEGHSVQMSFDKWRKKPNCPICITNPYKNVEINAVRKAANTKRVLAIDQATTISGWCIFDNNNLINFGKVEMGNDDTSKRISRCKEWLVNMIVKWQPDYIIFEDIQLQRIGKGYENVQTFKTLAHLQGVLINTCLEQSIDYSVVHVETWRSYCEIRGKYRADKKRSAQLKVKEWYDVSVSQDEADAIGLGKYAAEKFLKTSVMVSWE